jgi:type II secretory pathway pseudopilin PulG
MKIHRPSQSGLTLVELSITMGVVGALGLVIYSLLNIGTVLGAKNTATNTAHQQARVAMIEMMQDLHSSVSLPLLTGLDSTGKQASGISFQQWGAVMSNGVMTPNGGPHEIRNDANAGQRNIRIVVATGQPLPRVGQRLIVPTHQIEDDITAVNGGANDCTLTLASNLPVAIQGAGTSSSVGEIICYITDRCSYNVVEILDQFNQPRVPPEYKLQWTKVASPPARDIVTDITNPRPFSIPTTAGGALYYRFVAAIDLSTSDPKYSRRGYKSANILLNGQVPFKARLTTYQ